MSSGRSRIADVDFVATSVETIAPSVANALLISHFHLPQPGYPKFMVQVVDPETRLRVDVFPDQAIDEKHPRDAMLLGLICGERIAPLPPESTTKEVYRMDLTPCPRCEVSRTPGFTVAPRQRIFEILGYN